MRRGRASFVLYGFAQSIWRFSFASFRLYLLVRSSRFPLCVGAFSCSKGHRSFFSVLRGLEASVSQGRFRPCILAPFEPRERALALKRLVCSAQLRLVDLEWLCPFSLVSRCAEAPRSFCPATPRRCGIAVPRFARVVAPTALSFCLWARSRALGVVFVCASLFFEVLRYGLRPGMWS